MDYVLENEKLRIKVSSLGAELQEIYNKENNLNYLWDGNKNYWNRKSPILFPTIGKCFNDEIKVKGKTYNLVKHGFARDMEFKLVLKEKNKLIFRLEDNKETLKSYPYKFILEVGYELINKEIKVAFKVINKNKETMYFEIGGHPAFKMPLLENDLRKDYYLNFKDKEEVISHYTNKEGYATSTFLNYKLDNGYIKVTDDFFNNDALVIENQDINEVSLCFPNKKPYLTVKFKTPLFGIWSNKTAPFCCIEPWFGRCDKDNFKDDISLRDFINKLEKNEEFINTYSIIID